MTARGAQTITWDVENRPVTVTGGATFVYDGDGNRVKKTEGGQTVLYINQYYEKNITTGIVTTSYFLGGQLVATREGTTLRYVHQDSLGSTSTMSASDGTAISSISYFSFGLTRTGSVNTTKEFTGQRLDSTGLYYYNARYYDPVIGRFISPDSTGQRLSDPQTLNRYSYCENNPLKYTDPSGHWNWNKVIRGALIAATVVAVVALAVVAAPVVAPILVAAASSIAASTIAVTSAVVATTTAVVTAVATHADAIDTTLLRAECYAANSVGSALQPVVNFISDIVGGEGGEQSYTVQEGDLLNRVFDSRSVTPGDGYSNLKGLSYCPGGIDTPLSASQEIINRGLDPNVNNAQVSAVLRATQDIPAILRTSIGGTSPEIKIDLGYLDYLEVLRTFQNNP